jgi:hypothetical protein
MTELLEQQIILQRDIEQLQRDNSSLEDKNSRLKKESISILDLIEKQKTKLKELEEQSVRVLDKVRDEKIAWESQKREETEKIQAKELQANKIINREGYVRVQEKELLRRQAEVNQQSQATAVKEATFAQREELVKNLELQADKHWEEAKKTADAMRINLKKLQEKILADINKWEIK